MLAGRFRTIAKQLLVCVLLANGSYFPSSASLPQRLYQMEMLWDGLDVEMPEPAGISRSWRIRAEVPLESPPTWRVKVMGAADTGTNLAHTLLKQNLESILETDQTCLGWRRSFNDEAQNEANNLFPCRPFVTSVKPETCTQHDGVPHVCLDTGNGIHKHTVANAPSMEKLMAEANTVVVAMVRSPLSQIASWIKAPYYLAECMRPPKYGLPGSVCISPDLNLSASSALGVYQVYMEAFRKLEGTGRGATLIVVPYEQLLLNPADVLRSVLAAMGSEHLMPEHMIMVDKPAKLDGSPLGRQAAIDKLVQRTYLTELRKISPNLPQAYCNVLKMIDMDLSDMIDPANRSYVADCNNILP